MLDFKKVFLYNTGRARSPFGSLEGLQFKVLRVEDLAASNFTCIIMEKLVNFQNSKGTKLVGLIDNPSEKKDTPVFILCHGHGSNKNSKTFVLLKERVSREGVSTFRFDFYGHGESEGKFEGINATQAVDDITSAVNFLKNEGYSKIGLVGSSLGAFASIVVAARTPTILALALKSPTLDLKIWKERMIGKFGQDWEQNRYIVFKTSSVERKLAEAQLDAFVADGLKYDIFQTARDVKSLTLIVHGEKDETVPIETSKKMSAIIPNCKLVVIEGADHEYTVGHAFDQMIEALAQFLLTVK